MALLPSAGKACWSGPSRIYMLPRRDTTASTTSSTSSREAPARNGGSVEQRKNLGRLERHLVSGSEPSTEDPTFGRSERLVLRSCVRRRG